MRSIFLSLRFAATALVIALPGAQAQQTRAVVQPAAAGKLQRVTLTDGSQLLGRIVAVDSSTAQFESALGATTIPLASILSVKDEEPGQLRDGRYYFANPNATRLIFAPTGRMLRPGEGYVSDFWVFFPGFATGITNRFTFGGGISLIPGLGPDRQILYATPKLGVVQTDDFNAAVGALAIHIPGFDEGDQGESLGLLYGVATWGVPDGSVTAGVGYGYEGSTLADRPAVMIGGELRTAPRISLVSENYILPGGDALVSGAVRFMGQGMSVDLGMAHGMSSDGSGSFPVLNFMWKW